MKFPALVLPLFILPILALCPIEAQAQDYDAQVQEMYVAYYGRPGDVQRAMRVLADIDQHPNTLMFPINTGEYMDFF